MGFIERVSARRQVTQPETALAGTSTDNTAQKQTDTRARPGLTSSRNPDRHGPPVQETIGLLSWGALALAATSFIRVDDPQELIITWALVIFFATWIVTALAARRVRLLPARHRSQGSVRRR